MKKMMLMSVGALVLLIGLSFTGMETSAIDLTKSSVEWSGKKVTGSHMGTIQLQSGELEMSEGVLTGGKFVIDMNSIKCTDLQGGGAAKLEGHLKSEDFFGVKLYPTATFQITKVSSRGMEGDYKIVGDLTIKETTKEIKFNAQVENMKGDTKVRADITIDRTDFDVRYGSGSFFDNLGDKTIYDDFDLSVMLVVK